MGEEDVLDSEFELIRYKDNLPARIEEKQGNINIPIHWHKEIELIYVLEGNLSINVNGAFRSLASDSFLLINSAENHSMTAESAKCLILDISYEFAQQFDSGLYHSIFEVVAGSGAEEEIHNYLWQLSKTVNENELPALRQFSLITEIMHVLLVQCRHENPNVSTENSNIKSRFIKLALEYIDRNYREEIVEKALAESFGVNYVHFGKVFRDETGMLFQDYLVKIRLEHAMDALMNQHMSIEDAAKAGGFPSKRTFIAKCKRVYGITPFQLIKQKREVK